VAVSNVELIVNAVKAINPLRKVEQQSKKAEQALKKNQKAARDVEAALQRMGRKGIRSFRDLEANAARLGKRMSGLRGTIGKAAIAFAAFRAVQTGVQRVESERRIKLLGQRFGEYAALQNAATQAAKKFNLSQTEANQALANAFARLRPLGVSLEDITSTFGGFRTAAVLGGATAAEASAAFTQLSQALGSGALRGDEFRSVAEQAPLVLQAISDETGIAAGDLKDYAAQGLLTSDIVIKALRRIESEGAGRLAEALDGPAAKIKAFQNATEEVQVALTEAVVPELSRSFVILAGIIDDLKPVIQGVGSFAAKILGGIASTIERIRDPKKLASEVRTDQARKLMAKGVSLRRLTGSGMSNLGADYKAQEAALFAAAAKPNASPLGTSPISQLLGGDQAGKQKVDISQKVLDLNLKLLAAQESEQKRLAATLALMVEKENILQSGLQPREEELRMAQAMSTFRQEIKGIDKEIADQRVKDIEKAAEGFEAQMAHQDELRQAIAEQKSAYEELNTTFRNGIVDSILDAVEGTRSLKDSLLGVIKSMARLILQQQLMNALGGFNLFGGGGGGAGGGFGVTPATSGLNFSGAFANGGRPAVGKAALVGERGPELFVPDRAGTIIPNHAMGSSNIVVNVDASGSNVQGDAQQGKALGQAIGAAVQAELIKQKRPGGLLS
jgi:tape measure domain-containing protein